MLSSAYVAFTGDLLAELKSKSFCTEVKCSVSEQKTATICLSMKEDVPVLHVCGQIIVEPSLPPLNGFWSMELSEDVVTKHMEDDLNIYTEKGIASFGKLFGASMKGLIVLDKMLISDNNAFPLKMSYSLSGRNYIGILEVPLVQKDLDHRLIEMFYDTLLYSPTHSPHDYRSADGVSKSSYSYSQSDSTGVMLGDYSGDSISQTSESVARQVAAAPMAKKRRIGGVSINPSR